MLARLQWPTLAFVALALVAICAVGLFGDRFGVPAEAQAGALAFLGMVGTMIAGAMRALLRDADGNGIPDRFEAGDE